MFNRDNFTKQKILTGILIAAILYFSFFFLFGRYGFIKYTQLKRASFEKEQELSQVEYGNIALQTKIKALKSSNIDKDLLDEQVRKNLGYVDEDETVIYYK